MDNKAIGYKAIQEKLKLNALPHYRESYVAKHGRGKTIINNQHETHIYPKTYAIRDDNDLLGHLEFALKYDGINLEIIKALFHQLDKGMITNHIKAQPTGIYSRKIWFLYEYLLNETINLPDCKGLKYVNLLDNKLYFTSKAEKSPRHAIYNNLLGNKDFCPIIRKTSSLMEDIHSELDKEAKKLLEKYDPYLIERACNYLYTKETMSSYQIEREQPDKNRLSRFVSMLQQAHTMKTLTKEKLVELQNLIVDPRYKDFDYRSSQNYVGENLLPYLQKIHYISPRPENVSSLMQGLLETLNKMTASNINPVVIAAAISFGFVFIHPFEDGNGRIHRFLIHYILSKNNFAPKDMIFPVSSIMLKNIREYDAILESFSKPLLQVLTDYQLTEDGVMTVNQESLSFYQYADFTHITEYLFKCIKEAIYDGIEKEIKFLLNYDNAKKAIQNVVDMPDKEIDLFIKCVQQNNGLLSTGKKEKYFSVLTENEIASIENIIRSEFNETN